MTRRAAIGICLVLVAAACSSSHHASSPTTVSEPPTSAPRPATTTPRSHPTTKPTTPVTGTPVTTPGGTPVTNADGTQVTLPPPPPTTTITTPGTAHPESGVWKFALDFRTNPSENPFPSYVGGAKVWSLRESQSLRRDGNYPLLQNYSPSFGAPAVSAWHGSTPVCGGRPLIGVNTIDALQTVCNATIPGSAAFVYPDSTHMPVIAWTSPFDGSVNVVHAIADVDPNCGDGVEYYVDKGTTNLSDVRVTNRQAYSLPTIRTRVSIGQTLYFIVNAGPAGDTGCDMTQLQITVNRTA